MSEGDTLMWVAVASGTHILRDVVDIYSLMEQVSTPAFKCVLFTQQNTHRRHPAGCCGLKLR